MKAYEIPEFGIDSIKLVDRPDPEPGPYDVLVKVKAASLNYRDLLVVRGHYNPRMALPRVPLSDGTGEIVAIGKDVSKFDVGQRVAGIFSPHWHDGPATAEKTGGALGGETDGVAAGYVCFSEQSVVPIPEHLSYEEAATLPCAGVTAWNAVVSAGNAIAGETHLMLGTGGVSLFALQFSKMMGTTTIITSSSDEKLERAGELGADSVINYRQTPEWGKEAVKITQGRGVDNVVEVGGAGTLAQSIRAVRTGGHISLIGVLGGGSEMNPLPLLMRSIRMSGIYVGSRAMFEQMSAAITAHQLHPVIDKTFGFDELREAMKYMETGKHFGKIVVQFD